jgi:hypothetical protein
LEYDLISPRSVSLTGARIQAKVYLNEIEQDGTSAVATIPLNQIALVKYFTPGYIALPGVGLSPVLAVYTKKFDDMTNDQRKFLDKFKYPGYSATHQFYAPEYPGGSAVTDNRVTLLWNPDISVEANKKISVGFYNSDAAKRFHIVLEGFTSSGKLVYFEKIIE